MTECRVCHEPVVSSDGLHWTHAHGGAYCGTGDGATAYPPGERCPRCSGYWNTTRAGFRRRYACFACLHMWWNLRRREAQS